MRLTDDFTISTPPDVAFASLLDLELVAPCVPGAELGRIAEDGSYPGTVSVKLGPMKFVYKGKLRISEQDPVARTAVIEGEGRATGGADTAKVRVVMEVLPDGSGSRVRMTTDLEIKGRAAQMGAGIIGDVSRKLVREAATCIEARLAAAPGADPQSLPVAGCVGGVSLVASVMTARLGGSIRRLGRRGDATATDNPAAVDTAPTSDEPSFESDGIETGSSGD
jgi:carbon monoxide dehydrogenase subunit G